MTLSSVDPATGETIAEYEAHTPEQAADAATVAARAQRAWADSDLAERAAGLRRLAAVLEERREESARRMAAEMGKPLAQGRSEIDKCAALCRHYAEHGPAALADEPVATEAARSFVAYRPLGVVLAVMPWNFPYWQVFRFLVPTLMAGNGGLLKHAGNVCGSALDIEAMVAAAGFPAGLFRTLLLPSTAVAGLIEHPDVAAVTLTGSTPAGRAVAATSGRALKKTVLELGGSDPYVILDDADLPAAAKACAAGRMVNNGQSCIAAKRFIATRAVIDAFSDLVVAAMEAYVMGDPRADGVDVGPMARVDLRDELHEQVLASLREGARLRLGGAVPEGPGAFYPPTVLDGVAPGMTAFDQELFGPVAALVPAEDEEHAIELANATDFGLGAAIFTRDLERGERLARERLDAGTCFVNAQVRSDPRLPFGGIKTSGYGRELGVPGLREFVNVKTVWVGGAD